MVVEILYCDFHWFWGFLVVEKQQKRGKAVTRRVAFRCIFAYANSSSHPIVLLLTASFFPRSPALVLKNRIGMITTATPTTTVDSLTMTPYTRCPSLTQSPSSSLCSDLQSALEFMRAVFAGRAQREQDKIFHLCPEEYDQLIAEIKKDPNYNFPAFKLR